MENPYLEWSRKIFGAQHRIPNAGLVSSWNFHDEWGKKLFRAMLKVEVEYVENLLINIGNQQGCIAEFGVSRGDYLLRLIEIVERNQLNRRVFGFDSFEGLPPPHPSHDLAHFKEGAYAATLPVVSARLQLDTRPWVRLCPGWFSETLTPRIAKDLDSIAFLRMDADLYSSTKEVLDFVGPLLRPGTIIAFDDWTYNIDKGETKAFCEWSLENNGYEFEFLCFTTVARHMFLRVTNTPNEVT
ncbi:MAG: class I SAM-dependent methyltransferase [Nitrospira sp.]|nr:class I SAM-dependent methyltransferase [Nitrospira sp.]